MAILGWVTTKKYHPLLRFDRQTSTYGASTNVYNNTPTLFSSVHPTISSINFSAFRTLSPELFSSLIAKPTLSLFFDSCIGYLSKAEFVSSVPPLNTKPFLPTPRKNLASLIHYHQPVRSLRSCDQHYLLPTKCTTNFGSRSFRCSAPVRPASESESE